MENTDYQAIRELINSHGWKLLCDELDSRIKGIENVLLTPTNDDMFGTIPDEKALNLLNYKKAERIYLLELKGLPQTLLNTKISLTKKDN